MPEAENLALVQSIYAAFGRGDIAAVMAEFAPDVEWVNAGPAVAPYFGTHKGHAAVLENVFGYIGANLAIDVFEPTDFFANGDKVVVLLKMGATVKATGKRYDQVLAHVFTIAGGKVTHFRDIQNTGVIAEAMRAG
jgi:ketosteroid isomerase-like protein